jgi:hypothetical protein
MTVCESCGEEVNREDPTLVRANVAQDATVRGDEAREEIDRGPDALFHAQCFPVNSPVWRRWN